MNLTILPAELGILMKSETPASSNGHSGRPAGWVFLVALLVRLICLVESAGDPTFLNPIVDAGTYHDLARGLAQGRTIGLDWFWQPIFYPLFLSGVYSLFGLSIWAAKLLQAVLGAGTCWLVCRLGSRLISPRTGWMAGLLTAFYGPLILMESELMAEGWAAFWAVAGLYLLLPVRPRAYPVRYLGLGVVAAASILTRPTFALFWLAIPVWLLAETPRLEIRCRRLEQIALALTGFVLLAWPASWLSHVKTGTWSMLPYSSGINLYLGNNPDWERTVCIRPGFEWSRLTAMPKREGITDPWAASGFFTRQVVDYVRRSPGRYLRGLAWKTARFFNSRELPRNVDGYVMSRWSILLRALTWKTGGFGFPFGVLFPLTVAGLAGHRKSFPFPIWLFLFSYSAGVIAYFVSGRYRLPLIPVLAIPAAAGLIQLMDLAKQRHLARLSRRVSVLLLAGWALSIPRSFPEERLNLESEMYRELAKRLSMADDLDGAVQKLERSVSLNPGYAEAHSDLGVAWEKKGRLDLALPQYEEALRLNPSHAGVEFNLGSARAEAGRLDEAIAHLTRAVNLFPEYEEACLNLGVALARRGDGDPAIQQFRKVLVLNPNNVQAANNLGVELARQGKLDEAIGLFYKVLAATPDDPEVKENLRRAQSLESKEDSPGAANGRLRSSSSTRPGSAESETEMQTHE